MSVLAPGAAIRGLSIEDYEELLKMFAVHLAREARPNHRRKLFEAIDGTSILLSMELVRCQEDAEEARDVEAHDRALAASRVGDHHGKGE